MKRSDMLKNIVDVLVYGSLAARVDNGYVMITELAEIDAKEVLDLMEKLGMLPPLVPELCSTHVIKAFPEGYRQMQTENSTVFISKWEEETDP